MTNPSEDLPPANPWTRGLLILAVITLAAGAATAVGAYDSNEAYGGAWLLAAVLLIIGSISLPSWMVCAALTWKPDAE